MGDGFLGLRHYAIVGGNHQYNDIGSLGAAGAHGSESSVTGCIQKGDLPALEFHLVSANMLGNAAGLSLGDIRMANRIQQGSLAVIHVAEDRHDRWAGGQQCLIFIGNCSPPLWHLAGLFFLWSYLAFQNGFKTHFVGQDRSSIEINCLVDAGHYAIRHQFF